MEIKLTRFCPALPRMCYQPIRTDLNRAAADILNRLKTDQVLVLSGTNHQDFNANSQIYKTRGVVRDRLLPQLEVEGTTSSYLNLFDILDGEAVRFYGKFDSERIKERIRAIPEDCEIYLIDEAHLILPHDRYPEEFNETSAVFWGKMKVLLDAGKKIVFITARHPLDPDYGHTLLSETIARFFSAPTIEMPARA